MLNFPALVSPCGLVGPPLLITGTQLLLHRTFSSGDVQNTAQQDINDIN